MSFIKQREGPADLEALVAEARSLETMFHLYCESFQTQTGLFIYNYGLREVSYEGYKTYIAELKINIEIVKDIIQYIHGKKEGKKR